MTETPPTPQQRIAELVQRRGKYLHEVKLIDDALREIRAELKTALGKIPHLDDGE